MACNVEEREWGHTRKEKFTLRVSDFASQSNLDPCKD